jgi:uncharacterized protein (DUF362 family)
MNPSRPHEAEGSVDRRTFLKVALAGGAAAAVSGCRLKGSEKSGDAAFIARVEDYSADLVETLLRGFKELGLFAEEVKDKRVLLKPNLVESFGDASPINTHPLLVASAAQAFRSLGAASVVVAEGPGHRRDTYDVLEESGYAEILAQTRTRFVDLNVSPVVPVRNAALQTGLRGFFLPEELYGHDIIVSMAKMKTHHWVGVTLAMKNLFGVVPGAYYGWPKNVLHTLGINRSIIDVTATVKPHFAIVDGIVGMQGDGPIMGDPVKSKVLVMGRSLPAVDAVCARIMGIDPFRIKYLAAASKLIGTIEESKIEQRGETIADCRIDFRLDPKIPAHRGIRFNHRHLGEKRRTDTDLGLAVD